MPSKKAIQFIQLIADNPNSAISEEALNGLRTLTLTETSLSNITSVEAIGTVTPLMYAAYLSDNTEIFEVLRLFLSRYRIFNINMLLMSGHSKQTYTALDWAFASKKVNRLAVTQLRRLGAKTSAELTTLTPNQNQKQSAADVAVLVLVNKNQSTHDDILVESFKTSLARLRKHYIEEPNEDTNKVPEFQQVYTKIIGLKEKLQAPEQNMLEKFFENSFMDQFYPKTNFTLKEHLCLIWHITPDSEIETLLNRMVDCEKGKYGLCIDGRFHALMETIDQCHPDVQLIYGPGNVKSLLYTQFLYLFNLALAKQEHAKKILCEDCAEADEFITKQKEELIQWLLDNYPIAMEKGVVDIEDQDKNTITISAHQYFLRIKNEEIPLTLPGYNQIIALQNFHRWMCSFPTNDLIIQNKQQGLTTSIQEALATDTPESFETTYAKVIEKAKTLYSETNSGWVDLIEASEKWGFFSALKEIIKLLPDELKSQIGAHFRNLESAKESDLDAVFQFVHQGLFPKSTKPANAVQIKGLKQTLSQLNQITSLEEFKNSDDYRKQIKIAELEEKIHAHVPQDWLSNVRQNTLICNLLELSEEKQKILLQRVILLHQALQLPFDSKPQLVIVNHLLEAIKSIDWTEEQIFIQFILDERDLHNHNFFHLLAKCNDESVFASLEVHALKSFVLKCTREINAYGVSAFRMACRNRNRFFLKIMAPRHEIEENLTQLLLKYFDSKAALFYLAHGNNAQFPTDWMIEQNYSFFKAIMRVWKYRITKESYYSMVVSGNIKLLKLIPLTENYVSVLMAKDALYSCALNHYNKTFKLIVEKINALYSNRKSPLTDSEIIRCLKAAVSSENTELVKYLLDYPFIDQGTIYINLILNDRSKDEKNYLHTAAKEGSVEILRLMLNKLLSISLDPVSIINTRTNMGHTVMHYAATSGSPEIITPLYEALNSAENIISVLDKVDKDNYTPLMRACTPMYYNPVVIPALIHPLINIKDISIKLNFNQVNNLGENLFHIIAGTGNKQIITTFLNLCNRSERLNYLITKGPFGYLPIHYAASENDSGGIDAIIEAFSDKDALSIYVQSPSTEDKTPALVAVSRTKLTNLRIILNAISDEQKRLLHLQLIYKTVNHITIIENQLNNLLFNSITLLQYALALNNLEAVRIILESVNINNRPQLLVISPVIIQGTNVNCLFHLALMIEKYDIAKCILNLLNPDSRQKLITKDINKLAENDKHVLNLLSEFNLDTIIPEDPAAEKVEAISQNQNGIPAAIADDKIQLTVNALDEADKLDELSKHDDELSKHTNENDSNESDHSEPVKKPEQKPDEVEITNVNLNLLVDSLLRNSKHLYTDNSINNKSDLYPLFFIEVQHDRLLQRMRSKPRSAPERHDYQIDIKLSEFMIEALKLTEKNKAPSGLICEALKAVQALYLDRSNVEKQKKCIQLAIQFKRKTKTQKLAVIMCCLVGLVLAVVAAAASVPTAGLSLIAAGSALAFVSGIFAHRNLPKTRTLGNEMEGLTGKLTKKIKI